MWPKHYRYYPVDSEQVHQKVESGKGIVGCEMLERNGWGLGQHHYRKKRRGLIKLLAWFFGEGK